MSSFVSRYSSKAVVFATVSLGAFFVAISNLVWQGTSVSAQTNGAAIYSRNCARCHGLDGRAQTPKGRQVDAVDLTSDEWVPDTARDIRLVTRGKGSMPSFKNKLTTAQIEAVVGYIRRFKR